MVSCLTNRKPVRVPNFSPYRKSFLYTPCNCPVENCNFNEEAKDEKAPKKRSTPKPSRRIRKLAKPRQKTAKFHPRPVTQYGRMIQKIDAYREPYASTRIQQLSIPKVRKLVAAREEYQRFINRCWYDRFSKRIKRSMFTVYSRLANVQLPEVGPPKTAKMTPEQWARHQEWLALRAKHKVAKVRKVKPRKRAPLDVLMDRIGDLALPRSEGKKFNRKLLVYYAVKPGALKAIASTRLLELCVPLERRRRAKGPIVEKAGLPEEVLKAVASERVIELSKPKVYKNVKNEYRENPFTVEKRALKAKASDRILELAKPKPDHSKKKK
uniref:Testicular haploid n=1 Tax=Culex tarsalis TaxID=7177 RepID=A0A1Q3G5D5_CULTA